MKQLKLVESKETTLTEAPIISTITNSIKDRKEIASTLSSILERVSSELPKSLKLVANLKSGISIIPLSKYLCQLTINDNSDENTPNDKKSVEIVCINIKDKTKKLFSGITTDDEIVNVVCDYINTALPSNDVVLTEELLTEAPVDLIKGIVDKVKNAKNTADIEKSNWEYISNQIITNLNNLKSVLSVTNSIKDKTLTIQCTPTSEYIFNIPISRNGKYIVASEIKDWRKKSVAITSVVQALDIISKQLSVKLTLTTEDSAKTGSSKAEIEQHSASSEMSEIMAKISPEILSMLESLTESYDINKFNSAYQAGNTKDKRLLVQLYCLDKGYKFEDITINLLNGACGIYDNIENVILKIVFKYADINNKQVSKVFVRTLAEIYNYYKSNLNVLNNMLTKKEYEIFFDADTWTTLKNASEGATIFNQYTRLVVNDGEYNKELFIENNKMLPYKTIQANISNVGKQSDSDLVFTSKANSIETIKKLIADNRINNLQQRDYKKIFDSFNDNQKQAVFNVLLKYLNNPSEIPNN